MSKISGYRAICKQGHFNRRNHGGVALYIQATYPCREIKMTSEYQILAAQVNIAPRRTITFAFIYIAGSVEIKEDVRKQALESLPRSMSVMGDFNSHHDGGDKSVDSRGRKMISLVNNINMNIVNANQPTHISGTIVDLILVSPERTPNIQWQVMDSALSSDHFPIFISIITGKEEEAKVRNYRKVRWDQYKKNEAWAEMGRIELKDPVLAVEDAYRIFNAVAHRYILRYKQVP